MLDIVITAWTSLCTVVGGWTIGGFIGRRLVLAVARRRAKREPEAAGPAETELPALGWASKSVLQDYEGLPASFQAIPDLEGILRALEVKHGATWIDAHLRLPARSHGYGWPSWSTQECKHDRKEDPCVAHEHYLLHLAVNDLRVGVKERERALELAGVKPELDRVEDALRALGDEREAIQESTRRIL